ncbi:N/A [soil metagenome]
MHTASTRRRPRWSSLARPWQVLAVAGLAVYMAALDLTIVNVAFPDLTADFGATTSTSTLAWVITSYNITFAAVLLAGGRLADRYGRRLLFLTGTAVFVTGSVLCGLAPTPGALIAARVIQAVGAALLFPASLALILPEFPVERRSAAIGVWGAIGGVAAASGPSIGSVLIDAFSWRAAFLVNVPVGVLAMVAGRRILAESTDPDARSLPDIVGALIAAAAVGALVLGIAQGSEWGYTDERTVAALVVATALFPVFVWRCARHRAPLLDLGLFRLRFFTVANSANFAFSVGFFAMLFVNINFLTSVWGYSILAAGLAFTPGPLSAAAVAPFAGRHADRIGHRVVVVPGAVLFVAGMAIYVTQLGPEATYWSTYLPASVVIGVGIGILLATLTSASNAFLPARRFAMGSAFHITVRQVAAAVGIAVAVALLGDAIDPGAATPAEAMSSFRAAWAFLAAAVAAAGVIMAVAYRRPEIPVTADATPSEPVRSPQQRD